METVETLKRKMESTSDLHSVVSTMKALAAASIKQYEKAAESVELYYKTIERGLNFISREDPSDFFLQSGTAKKGSVGAVIFGSDQGMCGQFNSSIASFLTEKMKELGISEEGIHIGVVGNRLVPYIEEFGLKAEKVFPVPGSLPAITSLIYTLSSQVESWRQEAKVDRVILFYNRRGKKEAFVQESLEVLPIDKGFLQRFKELPSESKALPFFTLSKKELFSGLTRQYLFVSFYRACAQSLQSENASRLATMQAAEKNIEERMDELKRQFGQVRQEQITGELLDIVSGYEALGGRGQG